MNLMLQGMLEDRFKLKVHREKPGVSRFQPGACLAGGLKLKRALVPDGCSAEGSPKIKLTSGGTAWNREQLRRN
jgi:uncharacterized protein (TIGR03435 family)